MPTIVDFLNSLGLSFTHADMIEGMKSIQAGFSEFLYISQKQLRRMAPTKGAALNWVPSPGYAPFFVRRGADPFLAEVSARLIVSAGREIENEGRRRQTVVDAIRFLATPGRRTSSISRRASVLLAAWEETTIIEQIFSRSSLTGPKEFVEALKGAARGEDVACQRVTAIAAVLLPHIPNQSGRKISAASAAHELFLEKPRGPTLAPGYTWSAIKEDFVDEATRATRREFANPDFDPRPARRRIRARGRAR